MANDLVPLNCAPATLLELEANLTRFGPAEGAPDWLVSGIWLCSRRRNFFATSSVDVLDDGYVARPLGIDRPAAFAAKVKAEMPDIQGRLVGRGSTIRLPDSVRPPTAPQSLEAWPAEPYSVSVLLRMSESAARTHHIACALLFSSTSGQTLLVGTDRSTLAMVLSQDPAFIDLYRGGCQELTPGEYRELIGC